MEFSDILFNFAIDGEFVSCEPYGSGLINRTYVAVYNEGGRRVRYIVQRINTNLFKNVDGLMNNIKLVTEFNRAEIMKRGGDPDKKVAKRTAVQERIILPLRAQNYATLVPGRKSERTVFTMAKFTIPDGKCLVVELNEKNGGRHQSFVIENEDLVRANTINELQVR